MRTTDPISLAIDAAIAFVEPKAQHGGNPNGACDPDCEACVGAIVHRQLLEARIAFESAGDDRGSALLRVRVRTLEAELAAASAARARVAKERDELRAKYEGGRVPKPKADKPPARGSRGWLLAFLAGQSKPCTIEEIVRGTGRTLGAVNTSTSECRLHLTRTRDPSNRRHTLYALRSDSPAWKGKP